MDTLSYSSSDESIRSKATRKVHACSYEGCTASFSKNWRLVYHIRKHTGERPYVCNEPNCDKSYLNSFHLRRHKDTCHSKPPVERILCAVDKCGREFANKYSLKKHIKMKHNPERNYPFNCHECNLGFYKKRQLIHHVYAHTGVLPFECDKCKARCLTERALHRHARTHTNYVCSCERIFERWSDFLKHRKQCETDRIKCNKCPKTFVHESLLRFHETKHKKEKIYKCHYNDCPRMYLYKRNLRYHIAKYHKGDAKPRIGCTECNTTFTRRQTLDNHINLCHSKKQKAPKKSRAPRKDKGIKKVKVSELLTGLRLPNDVTKNTSIQSYVSAANSTNSTALDISKNILNVSNDINDKELVNANMSLANVA